MGEPADRRRQSLRLVLAGAAIWALTTVVLVVAGEGNTILFLVTVVPATGLAYLSFRRGTRPWAWIAAVICSLDLLIMVALLLYYVFSPEKSATDAAALTAWLLIAGSLAMVVGSIRLTGAARPIESEPS